MIGYPKTIQVGPVKKSQTEKNINANQELDNIYAEKKIDYCEVEVSGKNCLKHEVYSNGVLMKHTYAHRHKRIWYKEKGREKLLYSYLETIKACLPCHVIIESDRVLTNKLFTKLRGASSIRKATDAS